MLFLCRSGTPGGRRVTSCRARWQDTLHMWRWHSGKRGIFLKKVTIPGVGEHRFEARIESARLKSFESARLLTCPHPHCDNCDKTNAMLSMAFSEPSWIFRKNMLCCLNHRLCCYTKGFITFCFTDSLIREPLELSLPSKTLILFKGSVLRCFSDSYVPNFCRTFPAVNPHRACDYSQKSHYIGSFFPRYSFFSSFETINLSKRLFSQSEKSSIYSKMEYFASYLSRMAFL